MKKGEKRADYRDYEEKKMGFFDRCSTCVFVLVSLFFSPVFAEEKRGMTVDDYLKIVRVGDVLMSPDGKQVFYSLRHLDWSKNKHEKKFYMVSAAGGETKEFIGKDGGSRFRFSPDGKYLSFIRKGEKQGQLFILPLSGGEAFQLSRHRGDIQDYQWSKDGETIFFIADEPMTDEEEKEFKLGNDPIFVNEGPNGKNHGRWSNLWVVDLKTKKEKRITNEKILIEGFDVSKDGRIVLVARTDNKGNFPFLAELYLVNPGNSALSRLTNNRALEMDPLWSPDGKTFAFRASSDVDFDLRNGYFWIMNPDTGEKRKLLSQNMGEVDHVVWTPDGEHLIFNEVQGTNTNLFKLNISADSLQPLTKTRGTLRALAYSRDRTRMVYSFDDFTNPADIYVSDLNGSNPFRLTDANPWVKSEIVIPDCKVINWKSTDGFEIEGTFYLPAEYRKGDKVPLMLKIHGGPSGYWANMFEPDLFLYTGLGYAVLCPNVRGSSGYGDKILRGLIGEVGDGEYDDLMTGVDYVIEQGYVDAEKMGVAGWSWGGVSAGWVITQTDRFKAASVGAGVSSWISESGPGFNWDLSNWYIGGKHWTDREKWQKVSAINYVENVNTPALFLHGGRDQTSSTNQSMVYFDVLMERGVPTRFIKFPRQGHGVREPRLRRVLLVEEIRWMQKYVRGIEWNPWKRKNDSGTEK